MFLKEIQFRKTNFILSIIALTFAVSSVIVFNIMSKASKNETRRLTRDMGFNLRIVPNNTNMNNFWIKGYSDISMPQSYVDSLVDAKAIYYAHLTATLHKTIEWQNSEIILTGISANELEPKGSKKSKMIFAVQAFSVYVGYEIAKQHKLKSGDSINVLDKTFTIAKILTETGSNDDIRMYFDLSSLQNLLNMPNRISEIMALNCMCSTKGDNPLNALRLQLQEILPNTKVIMNKTIAVARERQRKMVDKYAAILLPIILIIAFLWVFVLTAINTMNRINEIGILRAIGFTHIRIIGIFMAKIILAGIIAAILGFISASLFATNIGVGIFKITARSIHIDYWLLLWAAIITPLFAMLSAFIPIMYAIGKEPAQILKKE